MTHNFQRKLLTHLNTWRNEERRKPLIIRGARQVGKTSLIKNWATGRFPSVCSINLEEARTRELFQSIERKGAGIALSDCLRVIENNFLESGAELKNSLIFIDEIQNVPSMLPLLRFFYEQQAELSVIAAGSYLEIVLKKEALSNDASFTFPVGRVENLYLYPLDFFEFLEASGETRLLKFLREVDWKNPPPPDIHLRASELFERYFLFGGMPEIILRLLEDSPREKLQKTYSSLMNGYFDDIHKYGLHNAKTKYLQHLLNHAPHHAGLLVNYAGFGDSAYQSREIGSAFEVLEEVMLLTLARACADKSLPWHGQEKRQKKLIYLDIGLANYTAGLTYTEIARKELTQIHRGRIAEQIVGQQLLSDQALHRGTLNYWTKDYREGSAEVDFCIDVQGRPCGIEVKSGHSGTLRSLFEFSRHVKDAVLMRVYSGQMSVENRAGALVHSLPFYLIPRLRELVASV